MIVEWKEMRVRPDLRGRYLEKDAEIWTAALAREPGFLGKEVWVDAEAADRVVLVIRWRSEEDWRSIPPERLEEAERRFARELPEGHEVLATREYRVESGR